MATFLKGASELTMLRAALDGCCLGCYQSKEVKEAVATVATVAPVAQNVFRPAW
jgi:hypothetical protein